MPQLEAPIVVSLSTSARVGKGRNVAYWQHFSENDEETKFEMLMNSKAAKAIGLTIPISLLVRAEEAIE